MSVETQQEVKSEESIGSLLESLGGPTSDIIDGWKAQYKDVFVSPYAKDEIYVWRTLKRHEFRQMQLDLQNPEKQMDQWDYEEAICRTCVLWPAIAPTYFANAKGGTATSLAEQIMQNSNFFNPQQAAAFVMKL